MLPTFALNGSDQPTIPIAAFIPATRIYISQNKQLAEQAARGLCSMWLALLRNKRLTFFKFFATTTSGLMELNKISSIEELRKAGSIPELIRWIKSLISPLMVEADNYEDLFDVVVLLQKNWIPLAEGPFISRQAELIYYLKNLEGAQRNDALGITDAHYEDASVARKWYRDMAQLIHPDKGGDATAFRVLRRLYDVMIDVREEEDDR
ncbi:hypothetical protein Q0S19_07740 [Stenotrophomonas indicatrix]|uniref:hypothetical protein n=1 Tax=Stenotrophomonas indicatrix TaxID=2045451 RepID=UPI00264E79DE|nr:hypothetical protein [Stenotrophomonas indicatrix]MDN8644350.1 hypothetical protein [Stenotrophomonas indicatrix]MDN8654798.1 hypothetical protein [Stenotrophomonas indicatrix]